MVKTITILVFISVVSLIRAQTVDTLSNLSEGTPLYAPRYTNSGQWGYVLGQNSSYRQQFGEKYTIEGTATVKGLITHLTGVFNHPNNYVEFNVYQVANNGLPGNRLGGKQVFYKNLNLSGEAFTVTFNTPIPVQGSFFVTFNVFDYLHGGYDGDTLGLMMGEAGSRSTKDLANFGRNAVQAHNHTKEDWKDFYSQNFTPIATHFALFPIIESDGITALAVEESAAAIKIFPNPASDRFRVELPNESQSLTVYNLMGEVIYQSIAGDTEKEIEVSNWTPGSYLIQVLTKDKGVFSEKIIIR